MATAATPQGYFYQQYAIEKRDGMVGVLLAFFLGAFGAHHFYLRRTGLGVLYLCFSWTGITALIGMVEAIFMPQRVREFNAGLAAALAASLGIAPPLWTGYGPAFTPPCPHCGSAVFPAAHFCSACGGALL